MFRSLREELDQEFSENKMKSSWQRWGRIENEIRKKMVCDSNDWIKLLIKWV